LPNYFLSPQYFLTTELGHRMLANTGSPILLFDVLAAVLDEDDAAIHRKPPPRRPKHDYSIYNNPDHWKPAPRGAEESFDDGFVADFPSTDHLAAEIERVVREMESQQARAAPPPPPPPVAPRPVQQWGRTPAVKAAAPQSQATGARDPGADDVFSAIMQSAMALSKTGGRRN